MRRILVALGSLLALFAVGLTGAGAAQATTGSVQIYADCAPDGRWPADIFKVVATSPISAGSTLTLSASNVEKVNRLSATTDSSSLAGGAVTNYYQLDLQFITPVAANTVISVRPDYSLQVPVNRRAAINLEGLGGSASFVTHTCP